MICRACAKAGDNFQRNRIKVAIRLHAKCKGLTHCDCQHKVEKGRFTRESAQKAGA